MSDCSNSRLKAASCTLSQMLEQRTAAIEDYRRRAGTSSENVPETQETKHAHTDLESKAAQATISA